MLHQQIRIVNLLGLQIAEVQQPGGRNHRSSEAGVQTRCSMCGILGTRVVSLYVYTLNINYATYLTHAHNSALIYVFPAHNQACSRERVMHTKSYYAYCA